MIQVDDLMILGGPSLLFVPFPWKIHGIIYRTSPWLLRGFSHKHWKEMLGFKKMKSCWNLHPIDFSGRSWSHWWEVHAGNSRLFLSSQGFGNSPPGRRLRLRRELHGRSGVCWKGGNFLPILWEFPMDSSPKFIPSCSTSWSFLKKNPIFQIIGIFLPEGKLQLGDFGKNLGF